VKAATIALKAPCCGKMLRSAALMYSATINVRRVCCGRRWSITIRPLVADPYREMQMHQADWSEAVGPTPPATLDDWETA
jgi:hypothetical protein